MDAKSEIILRQFEYFGHDTLLVNAPQDTLAQQLHSSVIWTWNYTQHLFFQKQQIQSHFSILPPDGTFENIILFVPKSKEQLHYILAQCIYLLGPQKQFYLVGEKNAGIEGAAKHLKKFGKTIKIDSARHCQLWQLTIEQQLPQPKIEQFITHYQLDFAGKRYPVYTYPGVFSQKQLDIGTAQLLPFLSKVKSGELLDFGCGAGVISLILALHHPDNHITAVDVDAFALASTQLTFEKNQISQQLNTIAVTDIKDLIHQKFAAIISNPPFHQGIKTDYAASENLCQFAYDHLLAYGELWIVANRFLNYSTFIQSRFGHCTTLADQHGFKILYAQKITKDHV